MKVKLVIEANGTKEELELKPSGNSKNFLKYGAGSFEEGDTVVVPAVYLSKECYGS